MMSNEFKENKWVEISQPPNVNPTFRKETMWLKLEKAVTPAGWFGDTLPPSYKALGKCCNRWQTIRSATAREEEEDLS